MSELAQYALLFLVTLITIGFVGGVWLIANLIGARIKTGATQSVDQPAESGSPINTPAWRRYHIHFYVFLLLFLAFDMEMAFMYPWAVVFRQLGLEAFIDMGIFLVILFLGLLYAWSQKGLSRP